jgi:hypothetical protein
MAKTIAGRPGGVICRLRRNFGALNLALNGAEREFAFGGPNGYLEFER